MSRQRMSMIGSVIIVASLILGNHESQAQDYSIVQRLAIQAHYDSQELSRVIELQLRHEPEYRYLRGYAYRICRSLDLIQSQATCHADGRRVSHELRALRLYQQRLCELLDRIESRCGCHGPCSHHGHGSATWHARRVLRSLDQTLCELERSVGLAWGHGPQHHHGSYHRPTQDPVRAGIRWQHGNPTLYVGNRDFAIRLGR